MMQDFHLDNEARSESGRPAKLNYSGEGIISHELGHWIDEQRDAANWRKEKRYDEIAATYGFAVHRGLIPIAPDVFQQTLTAGVQDKELPIMYLSNVRQENGNPVLEWLPHNLQGQQLAAAPLNFEQLQQRAKIPPGMKHWNNPLEASAESKACIYLGHASAAGLQKRSPAAFAIAKQQDQNDIDWAYGKGRMTRNSNGYLVAVKI